MRRTGMLLILGMLMTASPALAESGPVQLSLVTPIQILSEDKSVTAFRFNLLYGRNTTVQYVDIGLVNHTTADGSKATVLTRIRFEELEERVLPEMSAKVYFLAKEYERSAGEASPITVAPRRAITSRGGREVVFVVRDDTAVETPVEVGDSFGQLTEVKSGVTPGERVVLNPPGTLKTGTRIQLEGR